MCYVRTLKWQLGMEEKGELMLSVFDVCVLSLNHRFQINVSNFIPVLDALFIICTLGPYTLRPIGLHTFQAD